MRPSISSSESESESDSLEEDDDDDDEGCGLEEGGTGGVLVVEYSLCCITHTCRGQTQHTVRYAGTLCGGGAIRCIAQECDM